MTDHPMTLDLVADFREDGEPLYENVLVEVIGENRYRLLRSPGLTPGLAAGDKFTMQPCGRYNFLVLHRAGNVSLQFLLTGFTKEQVDRCEEYVVHHVQPLGGWQDGRYDGSPVSTLVFTIPVKAGFAAIEQRANDAQTRFPGLGWMYGNVYDPDDDTKPLNWWLSG
jgi:hypothetical protein